MPRQYSPKYKQHQLLGFFTKKARRGSTKRIVVPITARVGRRHKPTRKIASVVPPPKPIHMKTEKPKQIPKAPEKYGDEAVATYIATRTGAIVDIYPTNRGGYWSRERDYKGSYISGSTSSLDDSGLRGLQDAKERGYIKVVHGKLPSSEKKADVKEVEKKAKPGKKKHEKETLQKLRPTEEKPPSHTTEYHLVEKNPKRESISEGRDMPTTSEVEEEAYRMYMRDNRDQDFNMPERHELQEEGYLKAAQHKLMATGEQKELEKGYIENVKRDLEEHGYTIIPLKEANE